MQQDFGANRFSCFDLRRLSLRTALEQKSAFLSGTNRQWRPNAAVVTSTRDATP